MGACAVPAPEVSSEYVWVCDEPYMWFEVCEDEIGAYGIGELVTDDGMVIETRFCLDMGRCHIFRKEDVYLVTITVDGQEMVTTHSEEPILYGHYKMYNTKVKIFPEDDQIYGGKYSVLEFRRQAKTDAQN